MRKKDESFELLTLLLATPPAEIPKIELPKSPRIDGDDKRFAATFAHAVQWTGDWLLRLRPFGRFSSSICTAGAFLGIFYWLTLNILMWFDIDLGMLGTTSGIGVLVGVLFEMLGRRSSSLDERVHRLMEMQRRLDKASKKLVLAEKDVREVAFEREYGISETQDFAKYVVTEVI